MGERGMNRTAGSFVITFATCVGLSLGPGHLSAQEPETYHVTADDLEQERIFSPYVGRAYPDRVLFGDTHFHTNLSPDAGMIGTILGVDEALRFARGEKVISNTGLPVQLIRPLDFLAITDHAELMGLAPMIRDADPRLLSDPWGKWMYDRFNSGPDARMEGFSSMLEAATTGVNPMGNNDAAKSIWVDFVKKVEMYNEPSGPKASDPAEWQQFVVCTGIWINTFSDNRSS